MQLADEAGDESDCTFDNIHHMPDGVIRRAQVDQHSAGLGVRSRCKMYEDFITGVAFLPNAGLLMWKLSFTTRVSLNP